MVTLVQRFIPNLMGKTTYDRVTLKSTSVRSPNQLMAYEEKRQARYLQVLS